MGSIRLVRMSSKCARRARAPENQYQLVLRCLSRTARRCAAACARHLLFRHLEKALHLAKALSYYMTLHRAYLLPAALFAHAHALPRLLPRCARLRATLRTHAPETWRCKPERLRGSRWVVLYVAVHSTRRHAALPAPALAPTTCRLAALLRAIAHSRWLDLPHCTAHAALWLFVLGRGSRPGLCHAAAALRFHQLSTRC